MGILIPLGVVTERPLANGVLRDVLIYLRKEQNISQETLAKLSDVSRTHISRLETCAESATLETLSKILQGTGTSWETFGALMEQMQQKQLGNSPLSMVAEPKGPHWSEKL